MRDDSSVCSHRIEEELDGWCERKRKLEICLREVEKSEVGFMEEKRKDSLYMGMRNDSVTRKPATERLLAQGQNDQMGRMKEHVENCKHVNNRVQGGSEMKS